MAATIRDVAEAAGVSTATVSRALHADSRVTARTRLKVQLAAQRLDYRPSLAAARLATGRHGSVAVVACGGLSPDASALLTGACAALAEHGVDCALELGGGRAVTGVLRGLVGRVDAALVVGASPDEIDDSSVSLPVVVIGDGARGVDVDRHAAASLAAGHLNAMGYARVAVLAEAHGTGPARADETVRALAGRPGLTVLPSVLLPSARAEAAARATAALLADVQRPDALVCSTDQIVRGAHRALLRHNLVLGEDVGLIGFGTEQTLEDLDVTMVIEPLPELGAAGAREALAILGLLEGPRQTRLRPQLAVGSSTLRLRRRSATA